MASSSAPAKAASASAESPRFPAASPLPDAPPRVNLQNLIERYLNTIRQRGIPHLAVDDSARAILRRWMLAARHGQRAHPPASGSGTPPPATPLPHPAGGSILSNVISQEAPAGSAPPQPPQEDIPFFRVPGNSPRELWQQMERQLPAWTPLRDLGTLRSTAVPGMGNREATIMFVGDAPGYQDELARQPFQGEAGKKLDGMLSAMGLSREQVYITHLVKFRPALPRQTTNNRTPSNREILYSRSIVELEIRLVQPKVIVALGVVAARGLLQLGELPLAEYQARKHQYNGIPVIVTHHPSYLLRTSDLQERRRLWEEMLNVMQLAGLPISDKQRGYFLPKTTKA